MTTSGTFTFAPTFAGLLDEAAERAGIDPRSLVADHIISAKMSLNLLLTEWAARDGDSLAYNSTVGTPVTVSSGTSSFSLQTGDIDIMSEDMVLTYAGGTQQISITRISRSDYLHIPVKTTTGCPRLFYVDQSLDLSATVPTVYLWPVPDATCVFTYDAMRFPNTVTALSETIDAKRLWFDALAAGLALRLASKHNLQRVSLLRSDYADAYALARRAGSGQSQITFGFRGFGAGSRMRRR